jgi:hypothetical protein
MAQIFRSIRLNNYSSSDLDLVTYSNGEIVFDATNNTLRVMDGNTQGGAKLATQTFVSSLISSQTSSKAPINSPTFTGTVTIPAGANISGYATLASPTFTGTVSGITATMVGLGNVTNESKATMFTNSTFTGTTNATTVNATTVKVGGQNIKSLAIAMAAALS